MIRGAYRSGLGEGCVLLRNRKRLLVLLAKHSRAVIVQVCGHTTLLSLQATLKLTFFLYFLAFLCSEKKKKYECIAA